MQQQNNINGFHVIIAAAGSGARFGGTRPKQYTPICGKTLLRHTIDNVLDWDNISSIRVIIDPSHADMYHEAVKGLDLPDFIAGGKERNESINNALQSISNIKDEDIILIHDAARPFTKAEDVQKLLESLNTNRAATLATPVTDTLRKGTGSNAAANTIERDGLWAIQTPQAFRFGDLKAAHEQSDKTALYTDDTSLLSHIGVEVKLVKGSRSNIKITTQDDWDMGEALLKKSTRIATGTGFDVHAFEESPSGKPLILCGITIEHDRALMGHSDADVGLHAITDAILGAIGQGDIGQHFPPSDNRYKDMDSRIFLEKAIEMVESAGGTIQNIDATLICEAPKIGPHHEAMKNNIANIVKLPPTHINIKATTTEKLGFTGRGEGIAAQAIATIQLPVL